MAGEFAIINPRRRHRRKRARARTARPRRHRRARSAYANPRRRHVRRYARRHRARARRNPRRIGGGGVMGNVTRGFTIGAGAVATNVATGFISRFLPANMQSGPAYLAVKAGVGLIALPMALRFIPGGRRFAGPVAVGAGVVILLDIVKTYLAPSLPGVPGLSDYETGLLSDYETGMLSGYGDPMRPEAVAVIPPGGSIFAGGIYG